MRLTKKRNGKNVIPLLNAVRGKDMPYWKIDRADALHSYLSGDAADKLAAYEDAEEQGRLVIFPCKVGDALYAPTRNIISEFRVSQFDFGGYEKSYLWVNWHLTKGFTSNFRIDGIKASEIGKTVFLTREEAEVALKGGRNAEC